MVTSLFSGDAAHYGERIELAACVFGQQLLEKRSGLVYTNVSIFQTFQCVLQGKQLYETKNQCGFLQSSFCKIRDTNRFQRQNQV